MDDELFTRKAPKDKGTTSEGAQKIRKHSRKLKNKSTASRYYGQKLRTGRKDNSLSAEEIEKNRRLHEQGKKKVSEIEKAKKARDAALKKERNASKSAVRNELRGIAAVAGSVSEVIGSAYEEKQESDVAEEVVDTAGNIASGAVSSATSKVRNKKYSSKAHEKRHLSADPEAAAKMKARKEMQKRAARENAKAAENTGKIGRKITDKAEDLLALLGEFITEFVKDNPVISLIILGVVLLVTIFSGLLSSCGAIFPGGEGVTIITTFTAKDEDILAVEEDYKELEEGLQDDIDAIAAAHADYDEINYYLDEVGHNPYQLAAILTVIYEAYTQDEVQGKLLEILDLQYDLTYEEKMEIREREVTDTRWVEDDSYEEGGYYEEYTYTEEYEYYICNIFLVNRGLEYVATHLGLTDDEIARYEVLLATYGNKKYLFGDDDYYNVDDPHPGDYDDYHVPGEYLSDEQFARMLREAEKYLGVPYVWGGYSPSGFDCSGFVSYVINHCGNGWNYGRHTANGLRARTGYVSSSEAKPGDLVFFHGTYDTPGCSHVGIYVGNGMMIHAGNPVHYSSINTPYWQSHFDSFGRIQ